jgi:8-oxo-dGTP pyrophosphatase MutT (NUDIX family)
MSSTGMGLKPDSAKPGNAVIALNAAERERRWPNVRPKDAATMIILDQSGKEPRVLMGRRHPGHKFMPGKFVFPGGRVEPGDRRMLAAGALDAACYERLDKRVARASAIRGRALALAAIRETFEETGLMFGDADCGQPDIALDGTWADFIAKGVFPDLGALTFVARAITPPRRPKRFDTRFFTVDAAQVALKVDNIIGPESELVELVSVTFAEAGKLDLPTITQTVLNDVEERLARGFARHLPVPHYREIRGSFQREWL